MAPSTRTPKSLYLCIMVSMGCPSTEPTIGDETGGPSPAQPMDPFGGEGSAPPGDPDQLAQWSPPSSLGNGLVFDTRFDIAEQSNVYSLDVTGINLAQGVDWAGFVTPHRAKIVGGFRPTAVDAQVALADGPNGHVLLQVADRSAYASDDDANYRHETRTYVFPNHTAERGLAQRGSAAPGEPRPISIDTFTVTPDGQPGDTIAWVYDNASMPWSILVGEPSAEFSTHLAALAAQGYRPISVASRLRDGDHEYSAILVDDGVPSTDWRLHLGVDWNSIDSVTDAAWADGYYLVRWSAEHGTGLLPTFNLLWAKRSPALKIEARYNLDQPLFDVEDQSWRSHGYYLENAITYEDTGEPRYAGVWVRHEPWFREEIADSVSDDDPEFITRYKIFEVPLIQSMTLAGEQKEGEYFRPSATLHIWEGNSLVIDRAYTFAPSIYPNTPIDASMAVASVSKSITAAAVVKVLAENGVPITEEFPVAAGLANDWPVQKVKPVPRVVDVLRNVGGFAAAGPALYYDDHAKISALGYGDLPILEDEYVSFVVGEKLINSMNSINTNAHWREDIVGSFIYSNPGFSMLGELVHVQSGITYERYVKTTLLEPLNLDDTIFADRGNRNTVDPSLASGPVPLGRFEPLKSEVRKYLINSSHPYVCADDPPCQPKSPPSDSSPSPATWSRTVGPGDSSTPAKAGYERYAGSLFMGGAPLAAGGWHADGKSLGELLRVIAHSPLLMPNNVASQLWSPLWQIFQIEETAIPAPNWAYGLGWYVRGNWVAWVGGSSGGSGLVLHNLESDFTVVMLTNLIDNPISLVNPLLTPQCNSDTPNCWGTSTLGALFPCWDDPNTLADECPVQVIY